MALEIIVLAAGQGKRMHSALPKVLHALAGRPLLAHVLDAARALKPRKIVVVHGHGGDEVRAAFPDPAIEWVAQTEQLGTGHAVLQALPRIDAEAEVLILYGDVPLVRAETLKRLLEASQKGIAVLTAEVANPTGYGRIVRASAGRVSRIVEQKDANPAERAIREINAGFFALHAAHLSAWLGEDHEPECAEGVLPHRHRRAWPGARRRAGLRGQGRRPLGSGGRQLASRIWRDSSASCSTARRRACSKPA